MMNASDSTLSRLLIACLRSRWDPTALDTVRTMLTAATPATPLSEALDWGAFYERALQEGVGSLLYLALRDQALLPAEIEAQLRAVYYHNARKNMLAFKELATVLRTLGEANIPVVVLKGAALAEVVYDNVAVRPMCDLDLLVHKEDAPEALALLAASGYAGYAPEARAGDILAYENEVMLTKSLGPLPLLLELHWSLFDSPYYQRCLPMSWFWSSTQVADFEGVQTFILEPEALVLHLCGHVMLHHGGSQAWHLLWLHDIAEVIVRYTPAIDWQRVIAQAQAFDLILPLQEVLLHELKPWGVSLPEAAEERLRCFTPSQRERQVFAWLTAAKRPVAQRFWADFVSLDTWKARLSFGLHHLFPSPMYMTRRYRIRSPWLVPLFYPYRWFRGLWSGLASLSR